MDLMSLLTGSPQSPPPTPQQQAALRGQPDPSVQTGTPMGYTNPVTGQPSSSPGSPGVSGAIKDLIGALAQAFAPKSITQHKAKVDQAVAQGSGAPGGSLGDQF